MSTEVPSQSQRIGFWKDSYARSSLIQAAEFAKLILSNCGDGMRHPLRSPLTIAIIVAYGRPFKQRPAAVKLTSDCIPLAHKPTHDKLIVLRDKVIAHRDLQGPSSSAGFVSRLQVVMHANQLTVPTISPIITNSEAQNVIALIGEIIPVLDQAAHAFVTMYFPRPLDDGLYVVSLDENPSEWLIRTAIPLIAVHSSLEPGATFEGPLG